MSLRVSSYCDHFPAFWQTPATPFAFRPDRRPRSRVLGLVFSAPAPPADAAPAIDPLPLEVEPAEARPPEPQFRTWATADGQFHVEAKLLSQEGDEVTLERRDGKQITVPEEKPSAEPGVFAKPRMKRALPDSGGLDRVNDASGCR